LILCGALARTRRAGARLWIAMNALAVQCDACKNWLAGGALKKRYKPCVNNPPRMLVHEMKWAAALFPDVRALGTALTRDASGLNEPAVWRQVRGQKCGELVTGYCGLANLRSGQCC